MLSKGLSGTMQRVMLAGGVALALGAGIATSAASAATTATACTPLQLVYARGTTEAMNPYGSYLGNDLVADMDADVPGTGFYQVNYPAGLEPNSEQTGNADLVSHVEAQIAACPGEKFVLAGYSQGANVVADSFGLNTSKAVVGGASVAQLPLSDAADVSAVLMFGPPYNQIPETIPAPWSSVLDQFCTVGDIFCSTSPNAILGLIIHLNSYKPTDLSLGTAYAEANFKSGKVA